jgi:hypothetical protein
LRDAAPTDAATTAAADAAATGREPAASERPVFLLGSAWRSGTTLLQRVLSSGPELFVWGENLGMSTDLRRMAERLATYDEMSAREWREFHTRGIAAWIACLNPPAPGAREALRAFYGAYYEPRTAELGRARWGFTEVRHGAATAAFLGALFPHARFLFILRNPVDVVASMATLSWYAAEGGAAGVAGTWRANTDSLLRWQDPRLLVVRYDTLIAEPRGESERIARHLDLDLAALDLSLFAERQRGFKARPALGLEERRELQRTELVAVATRAGYDVLGDARLRLGAAAAESMYISARAVALRLRDGIRRRIRAAARS